MFDTTRRHDSLPISTAVTISLSLDSIVQSNESELDPELVWVIAPTQDAQKLSTPGVDDLYSSISSSSESSVSTPTIR